MEEFSHEFAPEFASKIIEMFTAERTVEAFRGAHLKLFDEAQTRPILPVRNGHR
jgi:hypothetical protein